MAQLSEFIGELSETIGVLTEGINQVRGTIGTNNDRAKALQAAREQRIGELALQLLPDLQATTVQKLATRIAGFIDIAQVTAVVSEENATIEAQIARLTSRFDPATYDTRKARLESNLSTERDDLALLTPRLDEMKGIPDLVRLIGDNYGTKRYRVSRIFNPIQFLGDWKAADRAVEEAKQKDWASLQSAYTNAAEDVRTSMDKIGQLNAGLEQLVDAHRQYDELQVALKAVPQAVLERLQTKLKARLASLDPIPFWMKDVARLNEQIAEAQAPNTQLNATLGKMSSDLAELQKVKTQASRSRKREVPDAYVQQLRTNRTSRGSFSGGGYSSPTFVSYYDNNNGFFDGLIMGEVLGSLGNDGYGYGHHHGGFSGGGGGGGYGSARDVDTSIQS